MKGPSGAAFKLFHAKSPSLAPGEHRSALLLDAGSSIDAVPGFLNNHASGAYDGVADDCLYAICTVPGNTYSFTTSGAVDPLLLRVYDSSGSVLAEARSPGQGLLDVRVTAMAPGETLYAGLAVDPVYGDNMEELGVLAGTTNVTVQTGVSNAWHYIRTGYSVSMAGGVAETNETYELRSFDCPVYGEIAQPIYATPSNHVTFSVYGISDVVDVHDPFDDFRNGRSPDGSVVYGATELRPTGRERTTSGNLFMEDAADWYSVSVVSGDVVTVSLAHRLGGGDAILKVPDVEGVEVSANGMSFVVRATSSDSICFSVSHASVDAPADSSYDLTYARIAEDYSYGGGHFGLDPDGTGFVGASRVEYSGFVYDVDGCMRGTFTIKAAKARGVREESSLAGSVTLLAGGRKSLKGTAHVGSGRVMNSGTSGTVRGGGMTIDVLLTSDEISGISSGGLLIYGSRNSLSNVDGPVKENATKWLGRTMTFSMLAASAVGAYADMAYGYSGVSVRIDYRGKVKISAVLSDGTKVSATSTLVAGKDYCIVPILLQAYSRKGGLGCLLWLYPNGDAEVANFTEWDAARSKTPFVARLAVVSDPSTPPASFNGVIDVDSLPSWVSLDKAASSIKIRYAASTGIFKAQVPCTVSNGDESVRKKATLNGVVSGGRGYGAAVIKKSASVPVLVNSRDSEP